MGKPVVTYISPKMKEQLPEELPIVSADFDELPAKIEELLADPQKRHALGMLGRAYAERYHDYIKVTKHLYNVYNESASERNIFKLL